jgi:hypothetical protein
MRPASLAAAGLLVLAACTVQSGPDADSPPAAGQRQTERAVPATRGTRSVAVYYLRTLGGHRYLVPEWHRVPDSGSVVAAAVAEQLAGRAVFPGSRPPFPARPRLLGTRLAGGTLRVDLSRQVLRSPPGADRRDALQALVYTATQFAGVRRVVVAVQGRTDGEVAGRSLAAFWGVPPGRPLVRDRAVALAPIALAQPTPDALIPGDRLVVRGEAGVAGGTVSLRLRDPSGRVVAQGSTSPAGAAPSRAPFSGSLEFVPPAQAQRWTLEALEVRPADGVRLYWLHLPVWVGR